MDQYQMVTGKNQFEIFTQILALRRTVWPDFIRVPDERILKLYELYPDFQISLLEPMTGEVIAIANSIPIAWQDSLVQLSDEGVSRIIDEGLNPKGKTALANILCAVSITVAQNYRQHGVSKILLQHLKNVTQKRKYTHLIVPVRPSLKSAYPLIPMDNYIEWRNKNDLPFDPWLRTHISLGARILKICQRSACIEASIQQWEEWTGMHFPGDGSYVIEDALAPLVIDYANNMGTYTEANVWVAYDMN